MIDVEDVFDNIDREIKMLRKKCHEYENAIDEQIKIANNINNRLFDVLKSMIGQKIYWAHKDWRKYETHIISKVEIDIVDTDFFGDNYKGKKFIKIFTDNNTRYYISTMIGETLFFDEKEAQAHTSIGLKYK